MAAHTPVPLSVPARLAGAARQVDEARPGYLGGQDRSSASERR